jgi:hypothetical protein
LSIVQANKRAEQQRRLHQQCLMGDADAAGIAVQLYTMASEDHARFCMYVAAAMRHALVCFNDEIGVIVFASMWHHSQTQPQLQLQPWVLA